MVGQKLEKKKPEWGNHMRKKLPGESRTAHDHPTIRLRIGRSSGMRKKAASRREPTAVPRNAAEKQMTILLP